VLAGVVEVQPCPGIEMPAYFRWFLRNNVRSTYSIEMLRLLRMRNILYCHAQIKLLQLRHSETRRFPDLPVVGRRIELR
jgi:hypothetical protein